MNSTFYDQHSFIHPVPFASTMIPSRTVAIRLTAVQPILALHALPEALHG